MFASTFQIGGLWGVLTLRELNTAGHVMNIETRIKLDRFVPRWYQLPIFDALKKGYRRIIAILPRRAGKDIAAFNLCIRQALTHVGVYFYIFPTYSQARKVIWDSLTNDGQRFLDFIPQELLDSTNSSEMKIRFKNQSIIQLVGSDNVDSLVGTNPRGVVFSEYALQDPRAYQFIRPILTANGGWALFISTPRGKNHLWELYQIAIHNPNDWFALKLTVEDTQHISLHEIEREKASGEMSEDLILQEYYTSFDMGIEGAYYAKYIDKMRIKGQIGMVPWEAAFKVHTAWDIGVRDSTTIIFFQSIGQTVRIIDCYENSKVGLEHYVKVLREKDYQYGKHIAPHDIRVQEFGTGMTRVEKARQLGINFTIASGLSIEDGIEAVRSCLSKVWIDERACAPLIKALENYRQEYDPKRKVYKSQPLHDIHSHFADSMRYLAISLPKTRDGLSPEELDRRYQEAVYGSNNANMPAVFRDDLPEY
jgi:phage terminase large subunit